MCGLLASNRCREIYLNPTNEGTAISANNAPQNSHFARIVFSKSPIETPRYPTPEFTVRRDFISFYEESKRFMRSHIPLTGNRSQVFV
jgi:hypothetical protein